MTDYIHELGQQLGLLLREKKWLVAVSESCTGGGLSQAIVAVPGASVWFDRGFVTYTNDSKIEVLGILPETLHEYGAVSEQIAQEMALGTIQKSHADIVISITGIAGPTGGTQEKPVGTVWFALAKKSGEISAKCQHFSGDREEIQQSSIIFALEWFVEALRA